MARLLTAAVLFAAVPQAEEIDPHLTLLSPLLGKTWQGTMRSPDGSSESRVIRRFDLLRTGKVIKLKNTNPDLGTSAEGFIFWDDVAGSIRMVLVEDSGVFLEGTVDVDGNVVTVHGTMRWPTKPPIPDVKQIYDVRNTFELISATSMRDSWFQNAFGPWRSGHVIDFEARTEEDDRPPIATPLDASLN